MAMTVRKAVGFCIAISLGLALSACSDDGSSSNPLAASSTSASVSGASVSGTISNSSASASEPADTAASAGTAAAATPATTATTTTGATAPTTTATATVATAAAVPLSISGAAAGTVSVGSAYSFTPSIAAATDSHLTFAVANKPSWTSFDTSTGKLTGTPGAANVGVSQDVVISVSDGAKTASLAAFAITVKSAAADSVTLTWTAPTVNADGTPATNLSGYHIYYGTSAKSMNQVVTVEGASDTKEVVGSLASGTWYFAVTSYNTQKIESNLSAVLTVTL